MKQNVIIRLLVGITFLVILLGKHFIITLNIFDKTEGVFTFNICFGIALTGIWILIIANQFSIKKSILILMAINFIYSILCFTNIVYFWHFGDYWSVSMLVNMSQLKDVSASIDINIFYWLIFIDNILFLILYCCYKNKIPANRIKLNLSNRLLQIMGIVILFGFVALQHFFVVADHPFDKRNANWQYATKTGFLDYYAVDLYHFQKLYSNKPDVDVSTINEIKKTFIDSSMIQEGKHFGLLENQNVIYVQLESFSNSMIGKKINGQEITPELNELSEENFYANNMFKQIGGGHTSDAEFLALTSLYPLEQQSINTIYGSSNNFVSVLDVLEEEGYTTMSSHGFRGDFWNRKDAHESYGFDQSYFEENFDVKKDELSSIKMGLKDAPFYEKTVDKLIELPEPFFAYVISLESHNPFLVDEKYKELELEDLEGTPLGDYYHSVHEADRAIGVFMDKLESEGLLENTTVVFFGDHDKELEREVMEELYPGDEAILSTKVPFVVVTPDQSLEGIYEHVMGQIDITPTMLHLMGIVPDSINFYGNNIFNPTIEHSVRIPHGSFATDDYYYLIGMSFEDGYAIDADTFKKIETTDEMKQLYLKHQQDYEISELIVEGDLLPRLYGKE